MSVQARFLEIFIVTTLGSFVLLMLVYQIFTYRLLRIVRRWDVFRMLPNYRLFVVIPRDLQLYIRDRLASGELTAWREIPLWSARPWYQAVWHPQHLVPQVLSSLVEDLVRLAEARSVPPARLLQSVPYSGLWHYRGISVRLHRARPGSSKSRTLLALSRPRAPMWCIPRSITRYE